MSNSSLISCTVLSPNHSGKRTHKIDTITPHCVVGQLSAKSIGECFVSTSRQASCNYGIGYNGDCVLVVDEANRSWCTSSAANDQRAVTIECASDKTEPYAMNNDVYESLISLCVDICKRNGISKLLWLGSKEATLAYAPKQDEAVLTAHRWFANKTCPGDWLYSRYGDLAARVTAALASSITGGVDTAPQQSDVLYRVQTGAFNSKANAEALAKKINAAGFETYIVSVGGLYKVQLGAFSKRGNAEALATKLRGAGFNSFITFTTTAQTIKVGSVVKVTANAKTYTGGSVASFVYSNAYTVDELTGDRAVLDKNGICTAFNIRDLAEYSLMPGA